MPETLADTVAALLRESRAAHDRARDARPRKQAGVAQEELSLARSLRIQAHNADRKHTVPAWAEEGKPTHEERMEFYSRQVGR
jgi:hypothetical protein